MSSFPADAREASRFERLFEYGSAADRVRAYEAMRRKVRGRGLLRHPGLHNARFVPHVTAALIALQAGPKAPYAQFLRHTHDWAAEVLLGALRSTDPLFRELARRALRGNFSLKAIRPELEELLSDPRPSVRRSVAGLVRERPLLERVPEVERLRRDSCAAVRRLAAGRLGHEATRILGNLDALLSDRSASVGDAAGWALWKVVGALERTLARLKPLRKSRARRSWKVGLGVAARLAEWGSEEMVAVFVRYAASRDRWASERAVEALYRMNRCLDREYPRLARMCRHPRDFTRAAGVFLLSLTVRRAPAASAQARRALKDRSEEVRQAAGRTLARIGPRDS